MNPSSLPATSASPAGSPLDDYNPLLGELPQQRFETSGIGALTECELLSLVLGCTKQTAGTLLEQSGSLAELAGWSADRFSQVAGITPAKGIRLAGVLELGKRMLAPRTAQAELSRPPAIVQYMASRVKGLEVEKFWVLCLDRRNRLKKAVEISSGTAVSCLADAREVFRAAVMHRATAIVCVHNHPSGDPVPSRGDAIITRQLAEAARVMDIDLLDHVIVGTPEADPKKRGFYSFREDGLI